MFAEAPLGPTASLNLWGPRGDPHRISVQQGGIVTAKVSPDIGQELLIQVVGVVLSYVESVGKIFFPNQKRFSVVQFGFLLGCPKLYFSSNSCFEHQRWLTFHNPT